MLINHRLFCCDVPDLAHLRSECLYFRYLSHDCCINVCLSHDFLLHDVLVKFLADLLSLCVFCRTWAQTIPGRVEFFSSEGSDTSVPVPVVALKNVDDSYPPQKKSFMMLKYMHDHYLDQYEWFMRADDDVYIKSERLESFLRSLNSSEAIFLGQTGMGARDELGKLALEPGENFCMGGPGVIMSREVLKRMVPHIRECLQEMYTTHEDVEVGRCVRRFAGVQCVWSYEVGPFLFFCLKLMTNQMSQTVCFPSTSCLVT